MVFLAPSRAPKTMRFCFFWQGIAEAVILARKVCYDVRTEG